MPIVRNEALEAFENITRGPDWTGVRIKQVRDQSLVPGGRTHVTFFESVDEGRPHPRLQTAMPPAVDPTPKASTWADGEAFTAAAEVQAALTAGLARVADALSGADLDDGDAPSGSLRFWRHSIRTQRIARFFAGATAAVEAALAAGTLPASERDGAGYAIREAEALAYAGKIEFDDRDTGTYHSFGHDKPFVHYLEAIIEGLPADGSPEMALLTPGQQASIRRQRRQARNHLDHLMRHKYAYHVVVEDDVEKTVGGVLIDRQTREVVSEQAASRGSLVPTYELLRVAPDLDHPQAPSSGCSSIPIAPAATWSG